MQEYIHISTALDARAVRGYHGGGPELAPRARWRASVANRRSKQEEAPEVKKDKRR